LSLKQGGLTKFKNLSGFGILLFLSISPLLPGNKKVRERISLIFHKNELSPEFLLILT